MGATEGRVSFVLRLEGFYSRFIAGSFPLPLKSSYELFVVILVVTSLNMTTQSAHYTL